jgi:hypothetical protein
MILQNKFNWFRLGATVAIVGGVIWTLLLILTAFKVAHTERGPGSLILLAILCILVGAIFIHFFQRSRSGWLGKLSTYLVFFGIGFVVLARLGVDYQIFTAEVFAAGIIILIISFLFFVAATFRAKIIPRWLTLFLLIGTILIAFFNFEDNRIFLGLPFGLSWIGLGVALWNLSKLRKGNL